MISPRITLADISNLFPITAWARKYDRNALRNDLVATLVVVVMLIPQSLGYALVAGLPPQAGLYASILPAVIYAVLGSSMTISIGPAAVPALMTLTALSAVAVQGTPDYMTAATILTFLCGVILLVMGALRFGFLTYFISHSVISAFTTASAIIIAASQIKHILGISAEGLTLLEISHSLWQHLPAMHVPTIVLGISALVCLIFLRQNLRGILIRMGFEPHWADMGQRMAPMVVVVGSTLISAALQLDKLGVKVVGNIPQGLPSLVTPSGNLNLWSALFPSAMLIALLIYVESISIAQSFAAKRREKVGPDRELWAVGACNVVSACNGGCPVAGSFSRSAVNYYAGAQTPAAGAFAALGISIIALFFTQTLYYLPLATLGATIIVAVLPVTDFGAIHRTWRYTKRDAIAMLATLLVSLIFGIEAGVGTGVSMSIAFFLQRTSQPTIVMLGRMGKSVNFRDVLPHPEATPDPRILMMRVDMSLYFANMHHVEEFILQYLTTHPETKHIVMVGSGINMIDTSAAEALEELASKLRGMDITLHMAAMKGHVLDRLNRIAFLDHIQPGQLFVSAHEAAEALGHGTPEDPAPENIPQDPL